MPLHNPDIVIVGAGAAGVGAARRLSGKGYSVVMIEQLDRPGGRAWTYPSKLGPIDLGCGWLHSADRNPWTRIAAEFGAQVDRRLSAWGQQFHDLGFSSRDSAEARHAFAQWNERLRNHPPVSDRASDVLDPQSPWTSYLQALSGYISGDELERISVRDYLAYDDASTENNWRLPGGYGSLVSCAMPADVDVRLGAALEGVDLSGRDIALRTSGGMLTARAVILTISSNVLANGSIALPSALDPWREAAARLPLGCNEKLYLEIVGEAPFEDETHVIGDPRNPATASYYIRPFGRPVIECFFGGLGARSAWANDREAIFESAVETLAKLFGSSIRRSLRPLAASDWQHMPSIGGGYSHALPGQARARQLLAQPFENRLFFAGEATHPSDFSTAHGAYESGLRAAGEVIVALGAALTS